ncbi:arylamine N-acetyltransferase family protein [Bacillus massiliglaciei]|uniref:arylamine N-acetyltransferase family protein n=1 Tax=Bacillus massiliglaciei TaxID=1816693 RepID=UPI000A4C4A52|nr:arylamine N-acetyltransferase [Bacillus massiliglaciei]
MTSINKRFRDRIGFPYDKKMRFEDLGEVLEKTAKTIPFENVCVIEKKTAELTKDSLHAKILEQKEGGLCYELNTILHYFLKENGFDAVLVRGTVYDQKNQQWSTTGKTHVTNLLLQEGRYYLVDTGFGGNLPLKPVPLDGEIITSKNGEFRVESTESEQGNFILYMKLRYKDHDWKKGYAFDSNDAIKNMTELNIIQRVITDHPESPFNKQPLLTRMTDQGNMTLTKTSFTEWVDGTVQKEEINEARYKEIRKEKFEM